MLHAPPPLPTPDEVHAAFSWYAACTCMCVHVCTRVHVCLYVHVCVCAHKLYVCACTCARTRVRLHAYACACMAALMLILIHSCACGRVHALHRYDRSGNGLISSAELLLALEALGVLPPEHGASQGPGARGQAAGASRDGEQTRRDGPCMRYVRSVVREWCQGLGARGQVGQRMRYIRAMSVVREYNRSGDEMINEMEFASLLARVRQAVSRSLSQPVIMPSSQSASQPVRASQPAS